MKLLNLLLLGLLYPGLAALQAGDVVVDKTVSDQVEKVRTERNIIKRTKGERRPSPFSILLPI